MAAIGDRSAALAPAGQLAGAAVLWRSAPRLLWILLLTAAVRSGLPAWLPPFPLQRYRVEVYPVLLSLTDFGAHGLFDLARSHARARQRTLRTIPIRHSRLASCCSTGA